MPRPQAEEAKVKGHGTALQKEKANVGIGTKTRAHPKRPRVHPNVVPPIPKQSSFRENATIVAYTATNLETVENDSRPKPKLANLAKRTIV